MQNKLPLPDNHLLSEYRNFLSQNKIAAKLHFFYLRWLRLYLNFCQTKSFHTANHHNIPLFLKAIAKEAHSPFLQQQAEQAIKLYFEMSRTANLGKRSPSLAAEQEKRNSNDALIRVEAVCAKLVAKKSEQSVITTDTAATLPIIVKTPNTTDIQLKAWQKLYDALETEIKLRHYSAKTLKSYNGWLRRFQEYVQHQRPETLDSQDVRAFLSALATQHKVAASTQNQAFNALLFVFDHLLKKPLRLSGVVRAKRKPYIPVVLSRREIDLILAELDAPYKLLVQLLYGCGLRLSEGLNLRIQDLNFDLGILTVHRGKGQKDRTLPLPKALYSALEKQVDLVRILLKKDLQNADYNGVFLPNLLEQKYKNASKSLAWQWLFPAIKLTPIPETGENRRFHLHDTHVQRAIHTALQNAMLTKRASAHSFRHSFASHLLQANVDICTIQELLGHSDIRTTMIYIQTVPSQTLKTAVSPLDLPV
jgi:integron integrase